MHILNIKVLYKTNNKIVYSLGITKHIYKKICNYHVYKDKVNTNQIPQFIDSYGL